jgi:UDPglucose 6-dehydrogenase
MIKYASNAFLATKISFINEVAALCDHIGADILQVVKGMALDPRIGGQFLNAGLGFGGSCFPKDVAALSKIGKKNRSAFKILPQVLAVNKQQRKIFLQKTRRVVGPLKGKTIAVWGLAFKPNTDDLREAPSLDIIPALLKAGARVRAYDPVSMEKTRALLPHVKYAPSAYEAAHGADAILIVTEWNEFRQIDFRKLRGLVKQPLILDGRNLYEAAHLAEQGFTYYGMGRGE